MCPKDKLSGVKTVPQSDLRVGTSLGKPHGNNSNTLRILQWNAGGMSQSKKQELMKILEDRDIDVFTIQEANLSEEQEIYFEMDQYNTHILPKTRQIASGIFTGIKRHIKATIQIKKTMEEQDKSEIVKIEVWKSNYHYRIYSIYNPPDNKLNLDSIPIEPNSILIGDFNAHSPRWGYRNINSSGRAIEDLINS